MFLINSQQFKPGWVGSFRNKEKTGSDQINVQDEMEKKIKAEPQSPLSTSSSSILKN